MRLCIAVLMMTAFVVTASGQPAYYEIRSPVKSEKGIKYREYRRGPKKGRVEKIVHGKTARVWKSRSELQREASRDIVLAREHISVNRLADENIANYNAESLRRIAEKFEASATASSHQVVKQRPEEKRTVVTSSDKLYRTECLPSAIRYFRAPSKDGFTSNNVTVLQKAVKEPKSERNRKDLGE